MVIHIKLSGMPYNNLYNARNVNIGLSHDVLRILARAFRWRTAC